MPKEEFILLVLILFVLLCVILMLWMEGDHII